VRIKVSTLVVVLAAAAGLATVLFLLLRESPGSVAAHGGDSRAAVGRRGRSLPRFHTSESAPSAEAKPSPPPSFVQPPPPEFTAPAKTAHEQLKERASKDGYLFREEGSDTVYVVQGGSKYPVPSSQEFEALGYKWDQVENVPPGSLTFLPNRPQERVLLRERNSPQVYYYENGQKRGILSPQAFERLGHKWSDIKVVPTGTLGSEAVGAPLQ
jgi:hypothetical protein